MKIVSAKTMVLIEKYAMENFGLAPEILMENAALGAAALAEKLPGTACIVSGPGNNGGDGLAMARLLHCRGKKVKIIQMGNVSKFKQESARNYDSVKRMGIEIVHLTNDGSIEESSLFPENAFIVDAIFGTGLNTELSGIYREMVLAINRRKAQGAHILSLDIPSGLNSDTGRIMGGAVNACETAAFGFLKTGHLAGRGRECCGNIHLINISIPQNIIDCFDVKTFTYSDETAKNALPPRDFRLNKGSAGKVTVFAGSDNMPGANILCCNGLYRAGAGLVKSYTTAGAAASLHIGCPEAVSQILPNKNGFLCRDSLPPLENKQNNLVIVGPGIGHNSDTEQFMESLLKSYYGRIIIDADGLNILSGKKELLKLLRGRALLTPHPGEMSRLTGLSIEEILDDTIKAASEFAANHGVTLLLKDSATVVAGDSGEVYINPTGSPSMAKAGTGDVLTGIIGGLSAQGLNLFQAAALGAFLHGRTGEILANQRPYSLMAGELSDNIHLAIESLNGEKNGI